MNNFTSIYLDLLRVLAAFGVVFVHANLSFFSNEKFLDEEFGHKLVMVFFVLSGFLVSFTTNNKKKDFKGYLIDRTSRLYSVVLPALVLTYLLDGIGSLFNPEFYNQHMSSSGQWWRALLNLFYLQQNWFLCTKPSGNGTFWSIAYEFWYYIIFGVLVYVKPVKKKIIIVLIISAFIGVKILLLLPVWLMGVAVHKISLKLRINTNYAIIGLIMSILLLLLSTLFFKYNPLEDQYVFGQAPLFFSSRFLTDYIYGLIVSINVFFASQVHLQVLDFDSKIWVKLVRYLSSTTFTMYLVHLPLLLLVSSTISYDHSDYMQLLAILALVFIVIAILSAYFEKSRYWYKQKFLEWCEWQSI